MDAEVRSPLADVPIPAYIAALPKADIHIHAETAARLEQILAKQYGQSPIDHRQWVAELLATTPPGMRGCFASIATARLTERPLMRSTPTLTI